MDEFDRRVNAIGFRKAVMYFTKLTILLALFGLMIWWLA